MRTAETSVNSTVLRCHTHISVLARDHINTQIHCQGHTQHSTFTPSTPSQPESSHSPGLFVWAKMHLDKSLRKTHKFNPPHFFFQFWFSGVTPPCLPSTILTQEFQLFLLLQWNRSFQAKEHPLSLQRRSYKNLTFRAVFVLVLT